MTAEKVGSGSDNTSEGTDEEEIDWDEIQVALDTNKEVDPQAFTKKKSWGAKLRRSARYTNDNCKIQDKAEAAKKKRNEIPGNLSSFSVLNSVSSSVLEKLAAASNIKLGTSSDEIAIVIDTMQAKELTKATLLAATLRVTEQEKRKEVESEAMKHTSMQTEVGAELEGGKNTQGQRAQDRDRSDQANHKRQSETENDNTESDIEGRYRQSESARTTEKPSTKKTAQEENRSNCKRREGGSPHEKKTKMKILFCNIRGLGVPGGENNLESLDNNIEWTLFAYRKQSKRASR